MEWDAGLDDGSATDFRSASSWNYTQEEMEALLSMSAADEPPSTSSMDRPWFLQTQDLNGRIQDFDFSSGIRMDEDPGNIAASSFHEKSMNPIEATISGSEPTSRTLLNRNKVSNRTVNNVHMETFGTTEDHILSGPQVIGSHVSGHHLGRRSPSPKPSLPASSSLPSPPHRSSRTSSTGSKSLWRANSLGGPSPSGPSPSSTTVSSAGLLDVNEITNVICEYPKHMLHETFWSPFVHHRHYRCSQGGLAEPIAIALCCVSANLHSVESSLPFVCKMICEERERLVNEFPTKTDNLEDALAALHAMCIYQIESILAFRSRKIDKSRLSDSEIYHHFLLKMTRRLCQEHGEEVSLKDNTAIDWHRWTMAETLRRTAFLVNMVNELSYHINALNSVYYESLHESLTSDIPLPAPNSMWRALDETEWAAARDATGWSGAGIMTLRMFMDMPEAGAGSHEGSSEDHVEGADNIQRISSLIINSAKHLRRKTSRQGP